MNSGKAVAVLVVALTFALTTPTISKAEEEKDFAVPAFSDLPLLGAQQTATQTLAPPRAQEPLNVVPSATQMPWMDINQDFQLNDFDAKQFEAIVESLNGERLSGLELSIRFRGEQKNQKESFPLLYDLDRDGMFTSYDVDYFTRVINQLDEGATQGNELIHKFRLAIFPQEKS